MLRRVLPILAGIFGAQTVLAGQFVVELTQELERPPLELMPDYSVTLHLTLSAGPESYAVFSAENRERMEAFLDAAHIETEKISEVLFVNSPVIGGGDPAETAPRPGHQVYLVERPIPGVGFFGLERKQAISKSSNEAIALLGGMVEWDHSYLTSEGTYCLYRADSPETLREHGALAGAPIGRITAVEQRNY